MGKYDDKVIRSSDDLFDIKTQFFDRCQPFVKKYVDGKPILIG